MKATVEQALISKIRTLSPQQVAEVEDFVEFLAVIAAEVKAARAERRAREQAAKGSGADRS